MKLELKHLAPYLPYKLKMKGNQGGDVFHLLGLRNNETCLFFELSYWEDIFDFKPMLRPLSDLTKEIEIDGEKFVPIDELELEQCELGVNSLGVILFQKSDHEFIYASDIYNQVLQRLFEWHFDVFGLIDEGLALPLI